MPLPRVLEDHREEVRLRHKWVVERTVPTKDAGVMAEDLDLEERITKVNANQERARVERGGGAGTEDGDEGQPADRGHGRAQTQGRGQVQGPDVRRDASEIRRTPPCALQWSLREEEERTAKVLLRADRGGQQHPLLPRADHTLDHRRTSGGTQQALQVRLAAQQAARLPPRKVQSWGTGSAGLRDRRRVPDPVRLVRRGKGEETPAAGQVLHAAQRRSG